MTRISIYQGQGGHDECVTPLIYTLNQIRVDCDIYINHDLLEKRGNIFKALSIQADEFLVDITFNINLLQPPKATNRIFWLKCNGAKQKKLIQKNIKYTLPIIFWTTFINSSSMFLFCQNTGLKVYGFIHNSLLSKRYERLFAYSDTTAVTFCRGMNDALERYNDRLINFYLPPMSRLKRTKIKRPNSSDKIRIAVPGKVDYHHRDYDLLIKFAVEAHSRYPFKFEFLIAGGLAGDDGTRLINSVENNGLEKIILLPKMASPNQSRFLKYKELFELLESCDCALENSNSVKSENSKISGAVNLCINFELPILYLKGFSMYKEFRYLANLEPEDLFRIAKDDSQNLYQQQKDQAALLKLFMEEENRYCLQKEISLAQDKQDKLKLISRSEI